jgi:hypothetical protein
VITPSAAPIRANERIEGHAMKSCFSKDQAIPAHQALLRRHAVRTQIGIAVSVYVFVAIIKKQLRLDVTLHTLLQILSLTLFEKLPLCNKPLSALMRSRTTDRQLKLFEF